MILTIITDTLHGSLGTTTSRPRKSPPPERYYYTSNNLFEQSLDIYRPASSSSTSSTTTSTSGDDAPIVALVVGSAWLGHRSFVYTGTSWWNSSGPKAVAELGYVCICIRHRGSFMKSWSILTLLSVVMMAALLLAFAYPLLDEYIQLEVLGEAFGGYMLGQPGLFLLTVVTGLLLIEFGGIGSAHHDDMQNDVMDALAWISKNEERLHLSRGTAAATSSGGRNGETNKSNRRLFIFGGYSSGGHVAATVTQTPTLWTDRNLPEPHIHLDSMLYLSPVLATKSCHDAILTNKVSSLSSSTSLPSLSPSEAGSTTESISRQSSMVIAGGESSALKLSTNPPTWLTDRVVSAVFGQQTFGIPSPIHTYEKSPPIPHLFVGCKNEMFGLNWLDTFFCSEAYSELLNGMGVDSRYRAVNSDHWNVLNSTDLRDTLRLELQRIESDFSKRR